MPRLLKRYFFLRKFVYCRGLFTVEQYRQCTYNVTMRRVRETIVAVEKQQVLYISLCVWGGWVGGCAPRRVGVRMCVRTCTLVHPACNAHAPLRIFISPIFRVVQFDKHCITGRSKPSILRQHCTSWRHKTNTRQYGKSDQLLTFSMIISPAQLFWYVYNHVDYAMNQESGMCLNTG